ncbi:hypothetical protein QVD17_14845 [Tagetes erecta]|uniref:MD-2-related lipid-recognition domain-containing protein n=1 Tax=Tagetes erecta TaxID=13708 RepID=A0AAD8KS25_TARER|nr:hypothetical protein QVD17_14845 [Tagetes erecta]
MEQIQIKLFIALVYIFSVIASSTHATDFKYCDKEKGYNVTVNGVEVIPNPVIRGKETSFNISAFTGNPLSEGKVEISVAYFGWHVYGETGDLCASVSCPIPAGNFTISSSELLPILAPPGSYTLQLKVQDDDKNELTCIKFDFSIGFLASGEGLVDT